MASECNIIGLGETAKQFNGKGITIGVNDAAHKWGLQLDYLVLQDNPTNFSFERYQNIINHPPKIAVYTNQPEWQNHFKNCKSVFFILNKKCLDSTFMALQVADYLYYHNVFSEVINIYGADFYQHPQLGQKIPQIIKQYDDFLSHPKNYSMRVKVPFQSALSQCQNVTLID